MRSTNTKYVVVILELSAISYIKNNWLTIYLYPRLFGIEKNIDHAEIIMWRRHLEDCVVGKDFNYKQYIWKYYALSRKFLDYCQKQRCFLRIVRVCFIIKSYIYSYLQYCMQESAARLLNYPVWDTSMHGIQGIQCPLLSSTWT